MKTLPKAGAQKPTCTYQVADRTSEGRAYPTYYTHSCGKPAVLSVNGTPLCKGHSRKVGIVQL